MLLFLPVHFHFLDYQSTREKEKKKQAQEYIKMP